MGEETAAVEAPAEDSLSDVFSNDEVKAEVVAETEPTGEQTEQVTEEAAPDKTEAAETETEDSTPEPEKPNEPWHLTAVMDEREKRQKAEKDLADFKSQHEVPTEPTSVFTDEGEFRKELVQDVDNRLTNATLNQSEFFAQREFGKSELAEKVETFKKLAADNPNLAQRFSAAISPYHELVDIVDQHEKLAKMENIDETFAEMKAKAKAEVLAEIAAEQSEDEQKGAKKREAITPSLAKQRSAGGDSPDAEDELQAVFGGN